MNFVGLDLGSYEFKGVELKKEKGGKRELVTYSSAEAPPHFLASDSEVDWAAYSKSLEKFYGEAGFSTDKVVAALPESQVFTRMITVPRMSGKELKIAMQWESEQYLPIPLDDVSLDYKIIGGVGAVDKVDVLLVAAPLTLTKKYLKIIGDAGLEVVGLETEALAAARSLVGPNSSSPTTLIVSIGARTTDISIVSGGFIHFTRSISTGGEAFARAVSQELGFEIGRAKEYMRSYGLEESQLEGKVMKAIKPIFDVVVSEVKRSIAYYTARQKDDLIKRVIVSGGVAALPGVLVYLAAALNLEVQIANPWEEFLIPEKFGREELEDIGPRFAVAVGLALKDM